MAQTQRPRRLIGMSTKMYFGIEQTSTYVTELLEWLPEKKAVLSSIDIFVIPDFLSLLLVAELCRGTQLLVGAQDCFHEDKGAFTGEVSPAALKEIGCSIVEIGHAERRRLFGETNADVAKKAMAVVRNGMIPLVCVGETLRGSIETAVEECKGQVDAIIQIVPDDAEIILAYEPVWAIGQAKPAEAEHIVELTTALREMCAGRQGTSRILYGGSAGPGLFEKLVDGVDGLFLGRFAHDLTAFEKTIQEVAIVKL